MRFQRSGLFKKNPAFLVQKTDPFLSWWFEAFEFVLILKLQGCWGGITETKAVSKLSPNARGDDLKTPSPSNLPACAPLTLQTCTTNDRGDPPVLIVLAFVFPPVCRHTIGSFLTCSWEPWETTALGKCYTQTFQIGIKYKYLDMSSPFIFNLSNFCMGSVIFH